MSRRSPEIFCVWGVCVTVCSSSLLAMQELSFGHCVCAYIRVTACSYERDERQARAARLGLNRVKSYSHALDPAV